MPIHTQPISFQGGRRGFLKGALAVSLFSGIQILPGYAAAKAGRVAANSKVRLAVVGLGNRGGDIGAWFAKNPLAEITCVCDVDLDGKHVAKFLSKVPNATKFRDFRKMFDEKADQFDAVIVGTPDHSHFPICMQAMALGKSVYVEKPMAHTFQECELMMLAAEKFGVVTQMGNQGHSEANYSQFKAWREGGVIKNVTRVDAFMNAPRRWHGWKVDGYPEAAPLPSGMDWETWVATAPMHPFNEKLHPANWRSWYDYGSGAFGDWGPHILDTTHRFLDLGLPEEIIPEKLDGPNAYIFPQASTICFKFPARGTEPAVDVRWYDGVGNVPQRPPELEKEFDMPTAGKVLYAGDMVFRGETHGKTLRVVPESKFKEIRSSLPDYPKKQSDHAENFLRACRGEEESRSPFSVAGPLTQTFTLGILAQRYGKRIQFDRSTKKIVGVENGDQWLNGPAPRPGWEQYYKI